MDQRAHQDVQSRKHDCEICDRFGHLEKFYRNNKASKEKVKKVDREEESTDSETTDSETSDPESIARIVQMKGNLEKAIRTGREQLTVE